MMGPQRDQRTTHLKSNAEVITNSLVGTRETNKIQKEYQMTRIPVEHAAT